MLTVKLVLIISVIASLISYFLTDKIADVLREKSVVKECNKMYQKIIDLPNCVAIIFSVVFVVVIMVIESIGVFNNFVFDFSKVEMLFMLLAFLSLSFIGSFFEAQRFTRNQILIFEGLVILASSFLFPNEFASFGGLVHPFIGHLMIAVVWWLFVNSFYIFDEIDEISVMQMVIIGIGVFFLGMVDVIALKLGYYALVMALILCAYIFYNWFVKIAFFGRANIRAFAYLCGWLMIRTASEYAWTAIIILPMFLWLENIYSLYKRFLYSKKGSSISLQALENNFEVNGLLIKIFKIGLLSIVFTALSLYTERPDLIVLISVVFVSSMINKFINTENKSFRELNKEFVASIKDNINKVNESINKVKNNKNDEE